MPIFSSLYGSRLDRELATDDSTILFTSARRKSAINEGQEEFAKLTKCLQRRSSVTLTGGQAEYDLNSSVVIPGEDFMEWGVEQVEFRYVNASSQVTHLVGPDLPRRTVKWLDDNESGWRDSTVASSIEQHPAMYYDRVAGPSYFLGFWPTPSTGSSASMEAFVPYVARPAPMTSDTNEPFTVNSSVRRDLRVYHQALVHYAAHQLEKLRADKQASESQLQRFLGYVAQYLQAMRVKGGTHVTAARNYFGGRRDWRGLDPRR
jgi:hypothetical protein